MIYIMCTKPYYIKSASLINEHSGHWIEVPCRNCLECLRQKRNRYFNKMVAYNINNDQWTYFITLTYDEEHVPRINDNLLTLCYHDFSCFMKRLRRNFPQHNFKYVVCGEYGSNTARPHYHLILFSSLPFDINIKTIISSNWKNGFVHVESLRGSGGLHYVCKYITKPFQYPAKCAERLFNIKSDDWKRYDITQQRKVMKHFRLKGQFVKSSKGLTNNVYMMVHVSFVLDRIADFFNLLKTNLCYGTFEKFFNSGCQFSIDDCRVFQKKIMTYENFKSFYDSIFKFKLYGVIDIFMPSKQLREACCYHGDETLCNFIAGLNKFQQYYREYDLASKYKQEILFKDGIEVTQDNIERYLANCRSQERYERYKKGVNSMRRIAQYLTKKDFY
ncbi:replication initiator protein [Microvirus mar5]|uniref:Replication initiator protein n=1 Tax=Microvirus mar5 TaxID=2851185 RepID=A0A8F5RAU6_9VIRU|nr:replication initiator protein [Microvirus mar5]